MDAKDLSLRSSSQRSAAGDIHPALDVPSSGLLQDTSQFELSVFELHEMKGSDDYYTAAAVNALLKVRRQVLLRIA